MWLSRLSDQCLESCSSSRVTHARVRGARPIRRPANKGLVARGHQTLLGLAVVGQVHERRLALFLGTRRLADSWSVSRALDQRMPCSVAY